MRFYSFEDDNQLYEAVTLLRGVHLLTERIANLARKTPSVPPEPPSALESTTDDTKAPAADIDTE